MSQLASSILKILRINGPARDLGQIALLLILSIGITLWGADNIATAEALFQSPASPPAPVEGNAPPPEPAPAQPPPAADQPQTEPPAAEPAPEQPQGEQPLPAESTPTQPQGDQTLPEEPTPEFTVPPAPERSDFPPREDPEAGSPRNFILDQAELIDSVVVSGAYVWLCCGVGLFLLIPIFLLVIYIRGRSKIQKQQDMFGG